MLCYVIKMNCSQYEPNINDLIFPINFNIANNLFASSCKSTDITKLFLVTACKIIYCFVLIELIESEQIMLNGTLKLCLVIFLLSGFFINTVIMSIILTKVPTQLSD